MFKCFAHSLIENATEAYREGKGPPHPVPYSPIKS